jgi:hypothetical protein
MKIVVKSENELELPFMVPDLVHKYILNTAEIFALKEFLV